MVFVNSFLKVFPKVNAKIFSKVFLVTFRKFGKGKNDFWEIDTKKAHRVRIGFPRNFRKVFLKKRRKNLSEHFFKFLGHSSNLALFLFFKKYFRKFSGKCLAKMLVHIGTFSTSVLETFPLFLYCSSRFLNCLSISFPTILCHYSLNP
jgi:hypothetical protein